MNGIEIDETCDDCVQLAAEEPSAAGGVDEAVMVCPSCHRTLVFRKQAKPDQLGSRYPMNWIVTRQ